MLSARILGLLLLVDSLDIWNNSQDIPDHIETIMKNAIAFLIATCFSIEVILKVIGGTIQWVTG